MALISLPETQNSKTAKERFEAEVADATLMLDYAIETGVAGPDERKLGEDIIGAIQRAQDLAGMEEVPSAQDRTSFEVAYRDLALFLRPVTAETLKATSNAYGIRSLFALRQLQPLGIIWSRKLWTWTLAVVAVSLLGEWFEQVYGPLPRGQQAAGTRPSFASALQSLLNLLVPFTYGAIGACVFLLKSSHSYIRMRQFDPLRIPEYYNRMILGTVAGGVIVLLVQQLSGEGGTTIRFSAAALGFLAGYNNELLFAAIERISAALLPKVGLDSIQQATARPAPALPPVIEDVSLKDLLGRLDKATTDDDKKLYAGLIQKIQQRL